MPSPHRLPSLADRRSLRLSALVVLYIGQGVPQGLLVVALPAYLTGLGADAAAVGGYLSLVLLPFALKVFVGPVLDRFTFLPMGRRRAWVLGAGLCVIAAFAAMATVVSDPIAQLALLTACGVVANSAVAVLDVAVDGMAIDLLDVDEQPRANALMWGGATVGVAISAVGTARLLSQGGVGLAASATAMVLLALWTVPLLLRERPGERLLPWTEGRPSEAARTHMPSDWRSVLERLKGAALLPSSVVLLVAAACAGALDGLVIAYMPVLAVGDLGWSDTGYSDLVALGQVSAGVIGMGIGSVLIGRVGRVRMLVGLAIGVAAVLAVMASVSGLWAVRATMVVFSLSYLITFVLLTITLLATGMALCSRAVAATQFALFTGAMNVGRSAGSGLLGPLDAALTPMALFVVTATVAAVVAALASRIDLDRHRQRLGEAAALQD